MLFLRRRLEFIENAWIQVQLVFIPFQDHHVILVKEVYLTVFSFYGRKHEWQLSRVKSLLGLQNGILPSLFFIERKLASFGCQEIEGSTSLLLTGSDALVPWHPLN